MCVFSTNFPCCACHSGLATVAWSKLVWRARVCVLCFSALWRGNSLVMCVLLLTLPLYLLCSGHCTYSRLIFKLQNLFLWGHKMPVPLRPGIYFFLTLHISPPHLRLHSRSLTHHVNCSVPSDATTATYCWVFLRILAGFCGAFAETGLAL